MGKTLDEHLFGPGPKRILALDGGGIRGMLSLQFLARIENILAARSPDPSAFRLRDYFDLIGGTSTGSIIAGGLATGLTVAELDRKYTQLGEKVFEGSTRRKVTALGGFLAPKFSSDALVDSLDDVFGETLLGDQEVISTGLAVMAKRIDTGSTWVLHNNPKGKYYDAEPGSMSAPNKDYRLASVVRASTAAPGFFDSEKMTVATGVEGIFIDGGVSPHNNPALQLLMLATLEGHGIEWKLGAEDILLVSVGTGAWVRRGGEERTELLRAVVALASLMKDCESLNEKILQWLSVSPTARQLDGEIGDMGGDLLGGGKEPWLSYLRYNAMLEEEWLARTLDVRWDAEQIKSIRKMDRPENLEMLKAVGQASAVKLVEDDHFPAAFDL